MPHEDKMKKRSDCLRCGAIEIGSTCRSCGACSCGTCQAIERDYQLRLDRAEREAK